MHLFTHLKDFVRYDDSEHHGFRFQQERGIQHSTSPMEAEILSIQENQFSSPFPKGNVSHQTTKQWALRKQNGFSLYHEILSLHKPPQRILSMKNEDFGP